MLLKLSKGKKKREGVVVLEEGKTLRMKRRKVILEKTMPKEEDDSKGEKNKGEERRW